METETTATINSLLFKFQKQVDIMKVEHNEEENWTKSNTWSRTRSKYVTLLAEEAMIDLAMDGTSNRNKYGF